MKHIMLFVQLTVLSKITLVPFILALHSDEDSQSDFQTRSVFDSQEMKWDDEINKMYIKAIFMNFKVETKFIVDYAIQENICSIVFVISDLDELWKTQVKKLLWTLGKIPIYIQTLTIDIVTQNISTEHFVENPHSMSNKLRILHTQMCSDCLFITQLKTINAEYFLTKIMNYGESSKYKWLIFSDNRFVRQIHNIYFHLTNNIIFATNNSTQITLWEVHQVSTSSEKCVKEVGTYLPSISSIDSGKLYLPLKDIVPR